MDFEESKTLYIVPLSLSLEVSPNIGDGYRIDSYLYSEFLPIMLLYVMLIIRYNNENIRKYP